MNNISTLEKRTGTEKAPSVLNGNGITAQSQGATDQVYCAKHGLVKSFHGQCETCLDAGYRDWDATRIAHELIPSWTGLNIDGRQVIVAPVHDALDAVQAIGRYKNTDALVLIVWDNLVTALDRGHIGPSWTVNGATHDDDADDAECARCCQPFRPIWGDERVCEQCWLAEHGPPHR